jgi:hypothetical protein
MVCGSFSRCLRCVRSLFLVVVVVVVVVVTCPGSWHWWSRIGADEGVLRREHGRMRLKGEHEHAVVAKRSPKRPPQAQARVEGHAGVALQSFRRGWRHGAVHLGQRIFVQALRVVAPVCAREETWHFGGLHHSQSNPFRWRW